MSATFSSTKPNAVLSFSRTSSRKTCKPTARRARVVSRAFFTGTHSLRSKAASLQAQHPRSRSSLTVQCAKVRRPSLAVSALQQDGQVAVLGAAGGIGQPLALLLKMNKLVTDLALYDIANMPGVAADLSHCNTPVKVTSYMGEEELPAAVTGADLVVIPAGVPRKPGMTRDDLFNINATIVYKLVEACGKNCPSAVLNIISNPVNSTVAIAAETLKSLGVYNPKKIIGVTTLDVVRANTFVAAAKNLDVKDVDVPVVGGHAGKTILPLLSQTSPTASFTPEEIEALTVRIQNAGTEVVEAKAGTGSATLSMAYAAARMAESCLLGLQGEPDIYECAFVESSLVPELDFFASKVQLGAEGVNLQLPLGELSATEKAGLDELIPELKGSIEKGVKFANEQTVKA